MGFLHKETTGVIYPLTQVGEKSNYDTPGDSITGHLKPYSLEDTTFNATGIDGSLFKMTVKGNVSIDQADRILINTVKYTVKDFKKYQGINFSTTKILLSTK